MEKLEQRGLAKRLLPPEEVLTVSKGKLKVVKLYATDRSYGSHMLICVGVQKSEPEVNYHPDNEDFILINNGRKQKPLFLIIGLYPSSKLVKLAESGDLSESDFVAMETVFNDPELSFFTMYKDTPHCEWTPPGEGAAPVFFVTEPSKLPRKECVFEDYILSVVP
jgi:hypothetical protein